MTRGVHLWSTKPSEGSESGSQKPIKSVFFRLSLAEQPFSAALLQSDDGNSHYGSSSLIETGPGRDSNVHFSFKLLLPPNSQI